ncbi:hypothetical protein FRC08_005312 [Ceratobasidium sp. 394]|nr:hypothetical protein FRC08_005312 [Ceratobasidium sp. 394]KAG9100583.1 hypothetical protein FS749_014336 [Ceratobasidium sp. UAMH 11750]
MDDEPIALLSSRFNPTEPGFQEADLVLLTTDAVFFYAHTSELLRQSSNYFGNLIAEERISKGDSTQCTSRGTYIIDPPELKLVDYSSDVLELVLDAVYKRSTESLAPSIATLRDAIAALVSLGYCPKDMVVPGSELFVRSLEAAETEPLQVYALAAQHSLELLAVAASGLTSAHSLDDVSDELALQMGPIYLKRLFLLHMQRAQEVRHSVHLPLELHAIGSPPGVKCNEKVQESVNDVWTLASGYVVVHGDPDGLDEVVSSFVGHLSCEICGESLKARMKLTVDNLAWMNHTI